jgi:predicted RNase H-like nuclease (RuvC/YqgF family)
MIPAIATRPVAILFVVAVAILLGALLGVMIGRSRRGRKEPDQERAASATASAVAIARWVEDGRQLFELWQARVERASELQGRLAAMAQELERLEAQVRHVDALHAENLRLQRHAEALLLERNQLRAVLARIGELLQRASEPYAGSAHHPGETA